LGAAAIEFVFPTHDFGSGEQLAQSWQDFWSGSESEHERLAPAGEFVSPLGAFDFLDLEITHRGGVKNSVGLAREFPKCD
jgi:hypothetical protein